MRLTSHLSGRRKSLMPVISDNLEQTKLLAISISVWFAGLIIIYQPDTTTTSFCYKVCARMERIVGGPIGLSSQTARRGQGAYYNIIL